MLVQFGAACVQRGGTAVLSERCPPLSEAWAALFFVVSSWICSLVGVTVVVALHCLRGNHASGLSDSGRTSDSLSRTLQVDSSKRRGPAIMCFFLALFIVSSPVELLWIYS